MSTKAFHPATALGVAIASALMVFSLAQARACEEKSAVQLREAAG